MAAVLPATPYSPRRRSFGVRSSARFFYLVDAIGRLSEPTATQLASLDSSYRSTSEYLAECPEFKGLIHEVHAHGSRQLGTLVRPADESREGFDIDLIARLDRFAMRRYGSPDGPTRLLNDLAAALDRYARAHGLRLKRWERCVTLEYAGGMTADIAPLIDEPSLVALHGATQGRIPDRDLRRFDLTNPRGYARAYDACAAVSPNFTLHAQFSEALNAEVRAGVTPLPAPQEVFDRLLSRLVQLLKLHRNVAFGVPVGGVDLSPSSIFVTTLAGAAYAVQAPRPHDSPLDLLLDVIDTMADHIIREQRADGTEVWTVPNPAVPSENLASCMNTPQRQAAFQGWQRKVASDVGAIIDAIEEHAGMDVLLERLERAFGPRASRAVRDEQANGRTSSRQAGHVTLITAAGSPVGAVARPHNFFGR